MSLSKYPFDFDTMQKGQLISAGELEQVTGEKSGTDKFDFAVLALRTTIETELWKRGHMWTLSGKGCEGGLKILTDAEAAVYNEERFKTGISIAAKAHGRALGVDVAELTAEQRAAHDRALCNQAAQLMAMKEAKKLTLRAYKRDTPSLGNSNSEETK